MRRVVAGLILTALWTAPAGAQDRRFYAGGSLGANLGARGPIHIDAVRTAGVLGGIRFADGWSAEFEVDRGFGRSTDRVFEGLLLAQGSGNMTREQLDRAGIFGRSVHRDGVGTGFSGHLVWRTREPGRVNAALYGGLSWRDYQTRRTVTITAIGPDVTYPPDHPNVQDVDETRKITGGGLTAGMMFPIAMTRRLTIAPDFRFTLGFITDESTYRVFHTGMRVMWDF